MDTPEPPQWRGTRTEAAILRRMELAAEKKAEELRSRGWTCTPPADK